MDADLVLNRVALLFRFSKSVDALFPDTFFEKDVSESSIANKIKECSTILLPSVKMRFFKTQLQEYWDLRNQAISCPFRYDRREAYEFLKLGIKNNPDFINSSTFGQLYQICLLRDAEFSMMQNTHNSFDIEVREDDYHESDIREDNDSAYAFRMIETELMSEQLPLFVRTPNGRFQAGTKRDCFHVNPRMHNPEWMKCYQFIGALIGRVMVKDHLWFGMPLAPTFWMLVQDEEKPTLDDFAKEDARLCKRLNKFAEAKEMGGEWPVDEAWEWINANDQTVALIAETPEKMVTRENYDEFCCALLEKLIGETAEQMKHLKRGIRQALGDFDYMRHYLNWHDLMVLTETSKYKQYETGLELFKEKTVYINCQAEDDQVKKFWEIYEKLNYENKKGYLNFVSGKSRIGDVKHRYFQEHRIRFDSTMEEGETPKSKPSQFELILASSYTDQAQMQEKLLEAISKGCGLEPDRD